MRILLRAYTYTRKINGLIVLQIVASSILQSQQWRWILLGLGPMTLTGFAFCAHTFVRINLHAQDHTLLFPKLGIAIGVLIVNKNELAAALVGRWCRCRCCQLAKRTGTGVSWLRALWSRKLAVQAAYILVPASRASTGRGILPSYLGLCWCNFALGQI